MASGKGKFSGGKMNKEWDGRKERRWGKKKRGGGEWQICWVTTRIRILVRGEDNALGQKLFEILHLVVIN